MSQDELTQAILNVIKKEIDSASKVLPTDLLSNIDIAPGWLITERYKLEYDAFLG